MPLVPVRLVVLVVLVPLALPITLASTPGPARADSIRGDVGSHVASELPSSDSSSSSSSSSSDDSSSDAGGGPAAATAAGGAGAAPLVWPWSPVQRPGFTVFGRGSHLDVTVATGLHAWVPPQTRSVHLHAQSYRSYSLELRGEIAGVISVRQLTLETDGATAPRAGGPAAAPVVDGRLVGAGRALAMIAVPVLRTGPTSWVEPVLRYETSSFATTATPAREVCLVARGADTSADPPDCTRHAGPLRMASRFESLLVGAALTDTAASNPGTLYAGLDVTAQRKPYQVDVEGRTLDDYLFDARFRGLGFAVGALVGGDRGLRAGGGLRVGSARVSLTDDLALNDVLPEGWGLSYLRWEAEVGWGHVVWQGPAAVVLRATASAGGSHFNYTRPDSEEQPSLSRDLFFAGQLALAFLL
jgi:hypothetical protein